MFCPERLSRNELDGDTGPEDTSLGEQQKGKSLASGESGCRLLPFACCHMVTPARPQQAICPLSSLKAELVEKHISVIIVCQKLCLCAKHSLCGLKKGNRKTKKLQGTKVTSSRQTPNRELVKARPTWACQQFQVRYQFVNLRENQPFPLPETTL